MTRSSAWTATNGSVQVPSQHKHSPLRFRPPEAERVWLQERAERTGEPVNAILTLAVRALIAADGEADPSQRDDWTST